MLKRLMGTLAPRFAALVSCAALGACAHHPLPTPSPIAAVAPARPLDAELQTLLLGNVLHFDYDSASLDKPGRERLARIGEYLLRHPDEGIRISGNCDERGTEEYNLALGQRRADVAKQYLTGLGIDERRIATVSYGKDRPALDEHDARAWAANRRDEFSESDALRVDVVATLDDADAR